MDLEKLEKLSCLKIAAEHKENVQNSLAGVFKMMQALDTLEMPVLNKVKPTPTILAEDIKTDEFMVSKENGVSGLHLESGYFLAPKVIKK